MKKYITLAIFAIGFGMNVNAQGDGFFSSSYNEFRETEDWGTMPAIIGHGNTADQSAPLGSGLLVLAGLGVAYAMRKKN